MASRFCKNCDRALTKPCPCVAPNCCGCRGDSCVRCCISNFPNRIHAALVQNGYYICRRCDRPFANACNCCPEAPMDRCVTCCTAYRHVCCTGHRVVFKAAPIEPIFVGPSVLPERKTELQYLSREAALQVLNKQLRMNPAQLTKNKFTRYAAVEIEASSIKDATNLNSVVTKWSCAVVRDSSTGIHGFEINTTPACGNALTEQLEDLCTALEQGQARTDENCGLHVHVDCRDYGYQEVQKFIKIYSVIEPALFAALHPARLHNNYCAPCGTKYYRKFVQGIKPEKKIVNDRHVRNLSETKVLKKTLLPMVYGRSALEPNPYGGKAPAFYNSRADHYGRVGGGEGRNELRYSAVNLHSYFLRGTIEFRMHHAALHFIEIYSWTKFLVALMDAVSHATNHNVQQFLKATPAELEGVKELYEINQSKEVCAGLVVLSSLLHPKYVMHLVSKIKLSQLISKRFETDYLPAQLFFNHLHGTGTAALPVEESGLTEV